jgi:hypothetical protein
MRQNSDAPKRTRSGYSGVEWRESPDVFANDAGPADVFTNGAGPTDVFGSDSETIAVLASDAGSAGVLTHRTTHGTRQ